MLAKAADFGARQNNPESEIFLDLAAQTPERFAEKLLYPTAPQANNMGVLLFSARLVVVLLAGVVHEVEFIHQPTLLEHLKGSVNRNAIQPRIVFAGQPIKTLRVQVPAG